MVAPPLIRRSGYGCSRRPLTPRSADAALLAGRRTSARLTRGVTPFGHAFEARDRHLNITFGIGNHGKVSDLDAFSGRTGSWPQC
jgi:hypothetical protein